MNLRDTHLYALSTSELRQTTFFFSFPSRVLAALVHNSRETRLGIYTRHENCQVRPHMHSAGLFRDESFNELAKAVQEPVGILQGWSFV